MEKHRNMTREQGTSIKRKRQKNREGKERQNDKRRDRASGSDEQGGSGTIFSIEGTQLSSCSASTERCNKPAG